MRHGLCLLISASRHGEDDENNEPPSNPDKSTRGAQSQDLSSQESVYLNLHWTRIREIDDLDPVWNVLQQYFQDATEENKSLGSSIPECVPKALAPYRRFTSIYSNSINHTGRFAVPPDHSDDNPISMLPDAVFAMESPLEFLPSTLSTPLDSKYPAVDETVVIISEESTSFDNSQDLLHFAAKLYGYSVGFCQVRNPCQELPADPTVRNAIARDLIPVLKEKELLLSADSKEVGGVGSSETISAHDLRLLSMVCQTKNSQTFMGGSRDENEDSSTRRIERTIYKLMDTAIQNEMDDDNHLVLILHGGSATSFASALARWKQDHREVNDDIIKSKLTIITLGALVTEPLPSGPAYLHISMMDDSLTSFQSRPDVDRLGGGSDDSVWLQSYAPYEDSLDSHSLSASLLPYLAILLKVNGTRSFRRLQELATSKISYDIPKKMHAFDYPTTRLHVPPNMDEELLPAMIVASGAYQHVISTDLNLLPSEDEARAIMEEQFGYDSYDEIVDLCSGKVIPRFRRGAYCDAAAGPKPSFQEDDCHVPDNFE